MFHSLPRTDSTIQWAAQRSPMKWMPPWNGCQMLSMPWVIHMLPGNSSPKWLRFVLNPHLHAENMSYHLGLSSKTLNYIIHAAHFFHDIEKEYSSSSVPWLTVENFTFESYISTSISFSVKMKSLEYSPDHQSSIFINNSISDWKLCRNGKIDEKTLSKW